jgi:signal transduction histidine kinase
MRHLIYHLMLLVSAARLLAAEPVVETIAQVRAMSPEEADRQLPVRLDATVIYFDPIAPCLFVQDGSACSYVALNGRLYPNGKYSCMDLQPGARVRITGVTGRGGFFPTLGDEGIELLGRGPLPAPRRINENELLTPALDSQWVEVPAVVTGVESGFNEFTISVDVYGWKLKAQMPRDAHSNERAAALMNRPVRLQGIMAIICNTERQMTGVYFFVPSFDQIIPSDTPGPTQAPALRAANELLRSGDTPATPVRVAGVVTQVDGNDCYLRDASGSVRVRAAQNARFTPGDRIEAQGFATMAPYRPVLRARQVTLTGHTDPPQPRTLDFTWTQIPRFHDELVALEADLLARNQGSTDVMLQCRAGDRFFEALLPLDSTLPAGLSVGDRVRLAGICELTTTQPISFNWTVDGFRLHLPKSGGVTILRHAPWWTLRHLLAVLGIVSGLACVALAWVWLLRRRVQAQTALIVSQRERVAMQDERQRIARELHDTVEQELSGLSMQLGNITRVIDKTPAEAKDAVELAGIMLRHCRDEARATIRDLRGIELEQRGLVGALENLLPGAAHGSGAQFMLDIAGVPRPLAALAEAHLLRIAQEGVANAAHHAAARTITAQLAYTPAAVTLTITDDGCGFDPAAPAADGHFGLLGMRERAAKMKAAITIDSTPGHGTTVQVVVPHAG